MSDDVNDCWVTQYDDGARVGIKLVGCTQKPCTSPTHLPRKDAIEHLRIARKMEIDSLLHFAQRDIDKAKHLRDLYDDEFGMADPA